MSEEKRSIEELENHPLEAEPTDEPAVQPPEEEHSHANYLFAFKVIAVLVAIILIIVILKASGVPVAIRDWFADKSAQSILPVFPLLMK